MYSESSAHLGIRCTRYTYKHMYSNEEGIAASQSINHLIRHRFMYGLNIITSHFNKKSNFYVGFQPHTSALNYIV